MRIERAELFLVPLSLKERFEISSGWVEERLIFLMRLESEGLVGWSECVADEKPNYSSETYETAWHILTRFVLPELIGLELQSPDDVVKALGWIRGHRMAKAAIEMGVWDLFAKSEEVSLAEKVSGGSRRVDVGVSLGLQPSDLDLVRVVGRRLEEGYKRVKIKIKPGRDVEMLAAVRSAFPEALLMADANSAYTLRDAAHLRRFDELDLMMIEQPLGSDDIAQHAQLQELLETPICLDESIRSLEDARLAAELGACRIINVKPGRVGGLGSSRSIEAFCRGQGISAWVGGMLESGVGRAHNVALACLPGFDMPGDISESRRYWERDLIDPEFVMVDGTLELPGGPGIGVVPDEKRIRTLAVRTAEF